MLIYSSHVCLFFGIFVGMSEFKVDIDICNCISLLNWISHINLDVCIYLKIKSVFVFVYLKEYYI